MADKATQDALQKMHEPDHISHRLKQSNDNEYLGDAVLGGIDGCVTTFAIVAGTVGGGFGMVVALALGLSNLVADGFSMAISNYHASKSMHDKLKQKRLEEHHHIKVIPEGEREEIRQIFAAKGFEGEVLEEIVKTITSDVEVWVDTMIQEEHGLPLQVPHPFRSAWITFCSFIAVGLMPIFPFFFVYNNIHTTFIWSCILTASSFMGIGLFKGYMLKISMIKEALSVLLMGGGAAILAFAISHYVAIYFDQTPII